jgi:hypothetical protein
MLKSPYNSARFFNTNVKAKTMLLLDFAVKIVQEYQNLDEIDNINQISYFFKALKQLRQKFGE